MTDANAASAILLDIEGTTTPVEFVYEALFPFARRNVEAFVRERYDSADTCAQLDALRREHHADDERGQHPPPWSDATPEAHTDSAARYVHWLMDRDRKSTALKSLQGKIWEGGYREGSLKSEVYPDVPAAFARWRAQGRSIHIYSSGSVLAQKLLFAHTDHGDLTPHLAGYFDTTTGPKKESASYQAIAAEINLPVSSILFLSDVTAELDAARDAGMQTALCVRPGNNQTSSDAHKIVHTFDVVFP